jgi:hypothetical protein
MALSFAPFEEVNSRCELSVLGPFSHVTSGSYPRLTPGRQFRLRALAFSQQPTRISLNFESTNTTSVRINVPSHFVKSTNLNASRFGNLDFANSAFLRRTPTLKSVDIYHLSLLVPTVSIHSSLSDFVKITLLSWKIF